MSRTVLAGFSVHGNSNLEMKQLNRIINEFNRLAQKEYKSRYDGEEKMIRWELYKRLRFDNTNKCSKQKLENGT